MFEPNESGFDRAVRITVGVILILAGLYFFGGFVSPLSLAVATWVGVGLGVIGVLALVTGITGYCVMYRLFHVTTTHGATGAA